MPDHDKIVFPEIQGMGKSAVAVSVKREEMPDRFFSVSGKGNDNLPVIKNQSLLIVPDHVGVYALCGKSLHVGFAFTYNTLVGGVVSVCAEVKKPFHAAWF